MTEQETTKMFAMLQDLSRRLFRVEEQIAVSGFQVTTSVSRLADTLYNDEPVPVPDAE